MTGPVAKPMPSAQPALDGPYDPAQNGRCALGHPMNGYGRCGPLNDPNDLTEVDAITPAEGIGG